MVTTQRGFHGTPGTPLNPPLPTNIEFTPSPSESISWVTSFSQFNITRAFNWNLHSPDCPAIYYNILASNSGSCPTTTNHVSIACTDVPTDSSTCTFAVQIVICGNITGESSQVLSLNNNILGQFSFNLYLSLGSVLCYCSVGRSERSPAIVFAISLGVALVICLINLTMIVLLIKSKTKVETLVVNTTLDTDQTRKASVPLSSHVNTKKNVAYVVHSPKTGS